MVDDFVIARNPEADSTLPFLIRLPLGPNGIVLKVRDTWPRTAKVYCHPALEWPASPDIVERVPAPPLVTPENLRYLRTKADRMHHTLDLGDLGDLGHLGDLGVIG